MANIDAPFGAVPIAHGSGGTPARVSEYPIASGLAANIKAGDWVKGVGDGSITVATATDAVRGVFKGVKYRNSSGEQIYSNQWVTGTVTLNSEDALALVYDDPNTRFIMQAHANFEAADLNLFADLVATAGNSATGQSKHSLSDVTGSEDTFRLIRHVAKPARADSGHGKSVVGGYAIVEIAVVKHELATGTLAVEIA